MPECATTGLIVESFAIRVLNAGECNQNGWSRWYQGVNSKGGRRNYVCQCFKKTVCEFWGSEGGQ